MIRSVVCSSVCAFGDRDARQRRRHVEQRALVERRHELGAEPAVDRDRSPAAQAGGADDDRAGWRSDHSAAGRYRRMRPRLIGCVSSERIRPTATALATRRSHAGSKVNGRCAREQQPQRRVERDREHRRDDHAQRLGVGERLEQPPLLRLERQHRQERHRDHQQREEARRADFLDRARATTPRVVARRGPVRCQSSSFLCVCSTTTIEASTSAPTAIAMPPSDMMLALSPISAERDERDQHGDRDRDDRDERARDVPEEQQDHERRR